MPESALNRSSNEINIWNRPIGLAKAKRPQREQPPAVNATPLNHQKRLAEIGQCSAEMLHEIRNTLASVLMTLDHFKTLDLAPASRQRLDLGLEATHKLCDLTRGMLGHIQPHPPALQWTDLTSLTQRLLAEMAMLPMAQGRSLRFECRNAAIIAQVDPKQFQQVLFNLLSNGLEAIKPGQTVFCTLRKTQGQVIVEIRNVVKSVAPAILEQWSQPFYSTKPDGTGLGLMISQKLIEDYGGQLKITSGSPGMVLVSATFPLVQAKPQDSLQDSDLIPAVSQYPSKIPSPQRQPALFST